MGTILGLPRKVAFLLAGLFVVTTPFYLLAFEPAATMDTLGYLATAEDLADGDLDRLRGRVPGFPLWMRLTGASDGAGQGYIAVGLVCHLIATWLIARLLYRVRVRPRYIGIFTVIMFLPPFVENAAWVLSENLTEIVLCLGIASAAGWLLDRNRAMGVVSAISFGVVGLIRPTYVLVWAVLALFLVIFAVAIEQPVITPRKALLAGASLIVAGSFFIGGFAIFNATRFGYLGVTPLIGLNLSTRTVRFIETMPESEIRSILLEHRDRVLVEDPSHTAALYIFDARPELLATTGMSEAELSRYLVRTNLRLIVANPLQYLEQVGFAAARYWMPSDALSHFASAPLRLFWGTIHFVMVAVYAFAAVWVAGRALARIAAARASRSRLALTHERAETALVYLMFAVVIVYTMVISVTIDVGNARFRTPTDIFIVAATLIGLESFARSAAPQADDADPAHAK